MLLTAAAITYYSARRLSKKPREDLNWGQRVIVDTNDRLLQTSPVKLALRCVQPQTPGVASTTGGDGPRTTFEEPPHLHRRANPAAAGEGNSNDLHKEVGDATARTEMTGFDSVTISTNPSTNSEFGDFSTASSTFFADATSIIAATDDDDDNNNTTTHGVENTGFRDGVRQEWIRAVFGPDYPPKMTASVNDRNTHDTQNALHHSALATPSPEPQSPSSGQARKSSKMRHGVGLAGIPSYTTYSVSIPISGHNANEKLGITLSRLSLGLYVRSILPGSEASSAGVLVDSVLVDINGMSLLAESSRQALERIWQYEGVFARSSEERNDVAVIQSPTCMTFIRNGKKYHVTFLCRPPFGIQWAPCGAFALVKRSQGASAAAGVQRGSIIASIDGTNFFDDNLDHAVCAVELRKAKENGSQTIEVELCSPPSAARSGYFERRQDQLSRSASTSPSTRNGSKSNKRSSRPDVAASHDGVEVRYHSFFGSPTTANRELTTGHDTVAILASRVASGELLTVDPATVRVSDSKDFRPCPPNVEFMANWTPLQCIHFCVRMFHARFDERRLHQVRAVFGTEVSHRTLRKLVALDSHRSVHLVDAYLLQLLCMCQDENTPGRSGSSGTSSSSQRGIVEEKKCDALLPQPSYHPSKRFVVAALMHVGRCNLHLARRMELVAASFGNLKGLSRDLAGMLDAHTSKSPTPRMMKVRPLQVPGSYPFGADAIPHKISTSTADNEAYTEGSIEVESTNASTVNSTDESLVRHLSVGTVKHAGPDGAKSAKPLGRRKLLGFLRSKGKKILKRHRLKGDRGTVATITSSTTVDTPIEEITTTIQKNPPVSRSTTPLGSGIDSTHVEGNNRKSLQSHGLRLRKAETWRAATFRGSDTILDSSATTNISHHELYTNMKSFLREMDVICGDLEGSLFRSISQKLAEWALQPWTPKNGTALANLTEQLRGRLSKLERMLPMFNPIASSEVLNGLVTQECYILPSAHFPMLLTFYSQKQTQVDHMSPGKETALQNARLKVYGPERLYRVHVELVSLRQADVSNENHRGRSTESERSKYVDNNLDSCRSSGIDGRQPMSADSSFVCFGAVSGTVMKSGSTVLADSCATSHHCWKSQNNFTFDCTSSWGAPGTLELRVAEIEGMLEGKEAGFHADPSSSVNSGSRTGDCTEVGFARIDLGPLWKCMNDCSTDETMEHNQVSLFAPLLSSEALTRFDEHGEAITDSCRQKHASSLELEVRITTEVCATSADSMSCRRSLLYKHNDDLRQELFAIELLRSCDRILKENGLDLSLLTFDCIPVGPKRGFIEWVPGSVPLSEICQPHAACSSLLRLQSKMDDSLHTPSVVSAHMDGTKSSVAKAGLAKYESLHYLPEVARSPSRSTHSVRNPIQDFLRSVAYSPDQPCMIRREVMDTYVRSCAGYTVITYILGVGDRHLDNLLLHQTGHFFHCDYSFMLGSDPKKYLPMRITEDMVKGMGGRDSDNFAMFLSLACAAFLTLRRPENVRHLLSMIRSLESARLDDVSINQTTEAAVMGVRERLQLGLTPEEAIVHIERLIDESLYSKMWMAVDAIHSLGKRF